MQVSCAGDLGDGVVLLALLNQVPGGPHRLLLRQSHETKMRTEADVKNWHRLFAPLAESQSYVSECKIQEVGEPVDWESERFRHSGLHPKHTSLFSAQLSHLVWAHNFGSRISSARRWLTVPRAGAEMASRVVVSRSERYHNPYFPWKRVVEHYGAALLFVGIQPEHAAFCSKFGQVEYRPVSDLLEMAKLIAGSALFIGNQSVAMAIAEGLKHRSIQETSLQTPDCIYKRDDAQWVDTGACVLPAVGGVEELKLQSGPLSGAAPTEAQLREFANTQIARSLAGYRPRTLQEWVG